MKIQHEFAPITIVLETKEDAADFEKILRTAASAAYQTKLYEMICILLRDMTK